MAVTIIGNSGIPQKRRINKGAFQGELHCALCNPYGKKKSNWQFVRQITPTRIEYRCKDCRHICHYDFSNNPNFHPYSPYKTPFFNNLVNIWNSKRK